jgi:Na+-driven multidrug efflux pump
VLVLPRFIGEIGAWAAMPIGDFLSILLSYILLIVEFKMLNKKKNEENEILIEEQKEVISA